MASREIYRQGQGYEGGIWRGLALGAFAIVVLIAVVNMVDLRIPQLEVPQI